MLKNTNKMEQGSQNEITIQSTRVPILILCKTIWYCSPAVDLDFEAECIAEEDIASEELKDKKEAEKG